MLGSLPNKGTSSQVASIWAFTSQAGACCEDLRSYCRGAFGVSFQRSDDCGGQGYGVGD
jgi:hypothetical protein